MAPTLAGDATEFCSTLLVAYSRNQKLRLNSRLEAALTGGFLRSNISEALRKQEGAKLLGTKRKPWHPLLSASGYNLTVFAGNDIGVVANDRESRAELAQFLARRLLGVEFSSEKVPMRHYDLTDP